MCINHGINVRIIKFVPLPKAVRQFSISPFISRSMALATSTLLYFEYLSNTEGERNASDPTATVKHHKNRFYRGESAANLCGDEGRSCWWGSQWRRSSSCPSCPPRPRTETWHRCRPAPHWLLQSCRPAMKTNRYKMSLLYFCYREVLIMSVSTLKCKQSVAIFSVLTVHFGAWKRWKKVGEATEIHVKCCFII